MAQFQRSPLNISEKIAEIKQRASAPTEHETPAVRVDATDKIAVIDYQDKLKTFCAFLNMMIKQSGGFVTFECKGDWYVVNHVQVYEYDPRYIAVTYRDFLGIIRIDLVIRFSCFKIFGGI